VKRVLNLAIGEDVEKGRLSELHRQRLLQGTVKDCVSRRVVEVGQHNRVFFCQRRRWTGAEIKATTNQSSDNHHHRGDKNLPESPSDSIRRFGNLYR
jgi:hypothetical protein